MRNYTALIWGAISSVILLVGFFIAKSYNLKILGLELKWIVVSAIPLLITLFIGGYIKRFKGFGVEIESYLYKPVASISLKATEVLTELPGDFKNTYRMLMDMELRRRQKIKRLSFVSGITGYDPETISQYIRRLPNLDYFEIVNKVGQFLCLIPIRVFRRTRFQGQERFSIMRLEELVSALIEDTVLIIFKADAITSSVTEDELIFDVLDYIHKSRHNVIAVLNEEKHFLGIIKKRDIENHIINDLLHLKRTTK